uniref:DDE-1 domain-containing protein n=1 Tax=Oryzias sinensis TaxID=183150 RepID=A0A8C7WSV8_9TELE
MKIQHFQGGPSWCFRFMKRRHLSIRARTTMAQQLPADYKEKLSIFRSYCAKKIADKQIQPRHITNMDEVPLTFDIPVSHTVEKTGTSTIAIRTTGHEKSAFTVVLGCQADVQKLSPMVIFKRKTIPKEKFPAGVIVKANEKGWMDEGKMKEWLSEVYVKRPGGFFHASPSLLICDSMRAHLTDAVKKQVKQVNSELAVIPGGLTKELQPLDIGVNRAFKVRLRTAWERWMMDGEHSFTKTGRQRRAGYATICEWIVDAWANVSASTVVRAFVKAGIIQEQLSSNETDSDDDESEPGVLDKDLAQLFISDTEEEDFDGF